jgi:archaeal cell division control protein 6
MKTITGANIMSLDTYTHVSSRDDNQNVSIKNMLVKKKKIFKNKALVKVSYIPEKLSDILHRGVVIRKLQENLLDVFQNLAPNNIIIYGKMGTGKTAVTSLVLEDLQEVSKENGIKLTVLNLNCEGLSENGVLGVINNALIYETSGKIKDTIGNSMSRNTEYLKKYYNELEGLLIIVLDEIDKVKNPNIINKLTRTISTKNRQPPCLIMITNNIHFKESLGGHTKSVLGENEIQFNPYDAVEISDILNARITRAFYPGVVSEMVVPLCSAFSAQEHGDARKAMNLILKSGEVAERKGKEIIEEEDVREANQIIEIDRILEIVKTLPTQSKVILYGIILLKSKGREGKCVTTGEMYNIYRQLCTHIDIDILTQRRVTDLMSELDMLGLVNAIVTNKGRQGRTKEISTCVPIENTRRILLEDYRLKSLEDFKTSVFNKMFSEF